MSHAQTIRSSLHAGPEEVGRVIGSKYLALPDFVGTRSATFSFNMWIFEKENKSIKILLVIYFDFYVLFNTDQTLNSNRGFRDYRECKTAKGHEPQIKQTSQQTSFMILT